MSITSEDMEMIEMKKESCILCNGTGKINPPPYYKSRKCDHKWNKSSFNYRLITLRETAINAIRELDKWKQALKDSK